MKSRVSGILFHPTSISGTAGIGTIGKKAFEFVDWLKKSNQSLWQILPLGPTGYGDSPYASFSTFAGNPLLIDLDKLVEKNWARPEMIAEPDYIKREGAVDFGSVVWWKLPVLNNAAEYFLKNADKKDKDLFEKFKKENKNWLYDYASFMSIKAFYDKKAQDENKGGIETVWFNFWPKELALCEDKAVSEWNKNNSEQIEIIKVIQFFFFTQWKELKDYANENGIKIVGDIPIFVAADSSDVWANQKMFQLDKNGVPKKVAGVPPDYFSATGQLWGNPLYDWDAMKKDSYGWWCSRVKHILSLVDYIRIDHFRGFEAYWSIPFGDKTAVNGKWIPGPKNDFFNTLKKKLGEVPLIAEDLGVITEGVKKLRDECGLPGMKVLQFAFSPDEARQNGMVNMFLPHMYPQNCIVYTGSHDNETMQGFLDNISDDQLLLIAQYATGRELSLDEAKKLNSEKQLTKFMIKTAFASTADMCVIPLSDVFAIGNEARMNEPSTVGKNWKWRFDMNLLTDEKANELSFYSKMYARNLAGTK
ncbi:MAG: 4-alpha-glucanotransferase [Treponema sp.]|nr:4-alpha-glucanotransferase [Candidatus Treponema scatequi]